MSYYAPLHCSCAAFECSRILALAADPASFRSWGLLAALPREKFNISGPCSIGFWVNDLIRRMQDLGMDLSRPMQGEQGRSGDTRRDEPSLFDILMQNMVWVDEGASALQLQVGGRHVASIWVVSIPSQQAID